MSGFAASAFVAALPWTAAADAAVLVVTYLAAGRAGRHSVIDTAWGLLFAAIAVAACVRSAGSGSPGRRYLVLALTVLWGVRLAVHIGRRNRGADEDPRYRALLAGRGPIVVIALVYLTQGALAYLVSMPVQVAAFQRAPLGPLAWVGAAGWLTGMLFEAIGDEQLRRFKADPARSGILNTGLWRYTRHPNYFGDACVWAGIFLIAAESWPGVLTIGSPLLMGYLLAFGSGKRVLEHAMADRPGYREYARRTSGFVPLPPRG